MSNAAAPEHSMEDVAAHSPPAEKDKGKAPAQTVQETDDSSSEDEELAEVEEAQAEDDEDDDDLAEIDTSNIISGGRRTRGKQIDFTNAAQDAMDDEEDDDEDFKAPEDPDSMDTN